MAGPGDPSVAGGHQDPAGWDDEIKKVLAKAEDLTAKELYKKGIPTFLIVSRTHQKPAAFLTW